MDDIDIMIAVSSVLLISTFLMLSIDPSLISLLSDDREYLYLSTGVGYSMLPTIKSGDKLVVLLKDSPDFSLSVGDILVYTTDNYAVAHRIIRISDGIYYVKGDNGRTITEVSYDNVVGKVVDIIPTTNIISTLIAEAFIEGG